MKVCLLGDYSGTPDEAMRKISREVAKHLGKNNQVLTLDLKRIHSFSILAADKGLFPSMLSTTSLDHP